MVTSNATQPQQQTVCTVKMVQVAEAYSYLSDQKQEIINLDSIPLPPPLSPPSPSKQQEHSSANILEQTIIKQKRLARFKNTDLRRKILLKRTFDLVCEIMDHENGFDFEDETETINKKQEASKKRVVEDDDEEEEEDESSDSDSDSDSSSSSSDSSDEEDDDGSSSSSSDESDEEEEEEDDDEVERDSSKRPIKQQQQQHKLPEIDQLIPKPSNPRGLLGLTGCGPEPAAATGLFSVVIQSVNHDDGDLDFTELNSIDISENYDDSAFNLDQVTSYVDEQPALGAQLYELKTFQVDADMVSSSSSSDGSSNLKRKRNSFEETVHQTEHDLFGTSSSSPSSLLCCSDSQPSNDQQLFYANPSLASLSDSTCFYNNQPSPSSLPSSCINNNKSSSLKRTLSLDETDLQQDAPEKRLKTN